MHCVSVPDFHLQPSLRITNDMKYTQYCSVQCRQNYILMLKSYFGWRMLHSHPALHSIMTAKRELCQQFLAEPNPFYSCCCCYFSHFNTSWSLELECFLHHCWEEKKSYSSVSLHHFPLFITFSVSDWWWLLWIAFSGNKYPACVRFC